MNKIPILTGHAVELDLVYASFEDLLDTYINGGPYSDARDCDATIASIVCACLNPSKYNIDYTKYSCNPSACSRLLYAFLLSLCFQRNLEADKYISRAISFLEKKLNGNYHKLFTGIYDFYDNEIDQDEAKRAHVLGGIMYSDLRKMVPSSDR